MIKSCDRCLKQVNYVFDFPDEDDFRLFYCEDCITTEDITNNLHEMDVSEAIESFFLRLQCLKKKRFELNNKIQKFNEIIDVLRKYQMKKTFVVVMDDLETLLDDFN